MNVGEISQLETLDSKHFLLKIFERSFAVNHLQIFTFTFLVLSAALRISNAGIFLEKHLPKTDKRYQKVNV